MIATAEGLCHDRSGAPDPLPSPRPRYYQPTTGRFTQLDPFGGDTADPQTLHKYNYAHSNPVMNIDPTGMFTMVELGIAVGIVALLAVIMYAGYLGYSYYNDDPDAKIVKSAIADATTLVKDAITKLTRWTVADQSEYTKWFGAPTPSNRTHVTDGYRAIENALGSNITWHKTSSNVFAYVYPGGPLEVWLGPLFWAAPAMGVDSKAGTMVHELSHEVWSTDDHAYGPIDAKALAVRYSLQAIDNADNYEYFAEVAP